MLARAVFCFGCHSGLRCFFLSRCHRRCRRARSYPVIRLHVIGERFTKAGRTRKALVRHLAAERGANINAADDEGTTALQAPLCVTSMHPASAGAHAHLTVNRSASEGSAGGDLGVVEQQQSRFCLYRCPRDSMNVVWNFEHGWQAMVCRPGRRQGGSVPSS